MQNQESPRRSLQGRPAWVTCADGEQLGQGALGHAAPAPGEPIRRRTRSTSDHGGQRTAARRAHRRRPRRRTRAREQRSQRLAAPGQRRAGPPARSRRGWPASPASRRRASRTRDEIAVSDRAPPSTSGGGLVDRRLGDGQLGCRSCRARQRRSSPRGPSAAAPGPAPRVLSRIRSSSNRSTSTSPGAGQGVALGAVAAEAVDPDARRSGSPAQPGRDSADVD